MICFSSKKTKQNPVMFIMIFVYGCNSLFCFFFLSIAYVFWGGLHFSRVTLSVYIFLLSRDCPSFNLVPLLF